MAWGKKSGGGKKKNEAEHTRGARNSTEQKHQDGQARRGRDQGGEKAEKAGRRKPNPNTRNGRAAAADLKAQQKAQKKKGGRGR